MNSLKEANEEGSIDALHAAIRENPNILPHIEQIPFVDTPLHAIARLDTYNTRWRS